jgi:hypothetical protein
LFWVIFELIEKVVDFYSWIQVQVRL